jgi:hypothetical protein
VALEARVIGAEGHGVKGLCMWYGNTTFRSGICRGGATEVLITMRQRGNLPFSPPRQGDQRGLAAPRFGAGVCFASIRAMLSRNSRRTSPPETNRPAAISAMLSSRESIDSPAASRRCGVSFMKAE